MMLFCNELDEEKWSGDAPGQDRENRREKEDGGSLVATKSSGDARRLAEVRRGIPLICDVLREKRKGGQGRRWRGFYSCG
jgi:hypothetical protein